MNRHTNYSRKIAFVMVVCIFSLLILSETYLIKHVNHMQHECNDKACPVCAGIQMAEAVIQQIGTALQTVSILFIFAVIMAKSISIWNQVNLFNTPVKMKVRMND